MNDHQLAAALHATSPDAIAGLYDAYGERLFRYCWSMLRNHEMALAAVRDTLAVAQAYIEAYPKFSLKKYSPTAAR